MWLNAFVCFYRCFVVENMSSRRLFWLLPCWKTALTASASPPPPHTHTELIIFMLSKVLCLCTLLEYYWFPRLSSRHSRINVSYFWPGMDCIMAYVAVNMFLLYTWQRMWHGGMWGLLHTMHNLGGGDGEKQNNNAHSLHISVCTKNRVN